MTSTTLAERSSKGFDVTAPLYNRLLWVLSAIGRREWTLGVEGKSNEILREQALSVIKEAQGKGGIVGQMRDALELIQGQAWDLRDDEVGREIVRRAMRAFHAANDHLRDLGRQVEERNERKPSGSASLIEDLRLSARVMREEAKGDHIVACRMDRAVERLEYLEAALARLGGHEPFATPGQIAADPGAEMRARQAFARQARAFVDPSW